MAFLTSKWVIAILIVVVILVVLFMIGRKSVSTEVQIKASQDAVWQALSDASVVKEWNKVLIPVEGELAEGNSIKYEFYQDEGGEAAAIDAKVKQISQAELINQQGGIPFILTFDHKYIIESTESGTTVRINEKYRGIMVPFWNPAPVEAAYSRLLQQLKDHLENE